MTGEHLENDLLDEKLWDNRVMQYLFHLPNTKVNAGLQPGEMQSDVRANAAANWSPTAMLPSAPRPRDTVSHFA